MFDLSKEKKNFSKIIKKYKSKFNKNTPFPNLVLDNFLSNNKIQSVYKNIPKKSFNWKTPTNIFTKNKSVLTTPVNGTKEDNFTLEMKMIFLQFNSATFLNFLEKISGIRGLLPDPYFNESGYHSSSKGGFLNPHADFSHHDKLGIQRRLNLILYLSKNWKKTYGGSLKLYDKELKSYKLIVPKFNRCVIFKTSKTSYHGHPDNIQNTDLKRDSFAMYYYTLPITTKKHKVIFPEDKSFKW